MGHGSLLAIGGGLALVLPTALTGLLDWLDIPKGTPARTTATVHLLAMVSATLLFALTFVAQLDGYDDGRVETLGVVLGLVAESVLTLGGYLGGTIVFVYGVRVLKRPDTPIGDALVPGRAERTPKLHRPHRYRRTRAARLRRRRLRGQDVSCRRILDRPCRPRRH